MKLIEYPGYVFKDLQCKTAPYHFLLKYLYEYPPDGYKFVEEPQELEVTGLFTKRKMTRASFIADLITKYDKLGGDHNEFKKLLNREIPYPGYFPYSKNIATIPSRPCLISPFPIITENPWMIEIEDWVTLFHWYFHNGHTANIDVNNHPATKILKALFSLDNFKGVITHIKQTVESLIAIFGNELAHKFYYVPLGCPKLNTRIKRNDDNVNFLFHGSFNHTSVHFQLRGGFYFLEAFRRIEHLYPNIRFTLIYDKAPLEDAIGWAHMNYIYNHPKIKFSQKYLNDSELNEEMINSDVFVIPAYRTHSMSIAQALSREIPVLTSNGWGINEYIKDNYNGWVVGDLHSSWIDNQGIFREEYQGNGSIEPQFVENLANKICHIMNNRDEIETFAKNASTYYNNNITIKHRNDKLKEIFDANF